MVPQLLLGGPHCASKTCRKGIAQLIDSEADYETTLTQVWERLANHVSSSHQLEWQSAFHHVSRMEPQTWYEKASPPPVPLPVPPPEPLGGVVPPPAPVEQPLASLRDDVVPIQFHTQGEPDAGCRR